MDRYLSQRRFLGTLKVINMTFNVNDNASSIAR